MIIAIDNNGKITAGFGVNKYLLIDKDKQGKILHKQEISNPYWTGSSGHGVKFLKSVSVDKFISKQLGPGVIQNLKGNNIKYEVLDSIK